MKFRDGQRVKLVSNKGNGIIKFSYPPLGTCGTISLKYTCSLPNNADHVGVAWDNSQRLCHHEGDLAPLNEFKGTRIKKEN